MHRRTLLASSVATLTTLTGCSSLTDTDTETPVVDTDATAEWSETYLENGYRVTVTVQLHDKERAELGMMGGETLRTISESGTYTIAGPNTEHGSASMSDLFVVRTPSELSDRMSSAASFVVGSQVTPDVSVPPTHLIGVNGSTDPSLEGTDRMTRTYTQQAAYGPSSLVLELPEPLFTYYENRTRVPQYGSYVSDTYDDEYLHDLVEEFESFAEERGRDNDVAVINHMMSFVQNLEYTKDKIGTGYNEYPKYPIETLVDKGGDCEDTCILLASLLNQFNYGSVLLIFREEQHMAVGVQGEPGLPGTYFEYEGDRYYYVETTDTGWELGEAPQDLQNATVEFAPVNSNPVFVFSYAVTIDDERLAVEIQVKNIGDAPGQPTVQALLENESEGTVGSDRQRLSRLGPQAETTTMLYPDPPAEQTLRVRIQIARNGTLHDELTSEYQEPLDLPS